MALALIDSLRVQKGIRVDFAWIEIELGLVGVHPHPLMRLRFHGTPPVRFKRFGAIAPPRIHTVVVETSLCLLPINGPCLIGKRIVSGLIP